MIASSRSEVVPAFLKQFMNVSYATVSQEATSIFIAFRMEILDRVEFYRMSSTIIELPALCNSFKTPNDTMFHQLEN